MGYIRTSAPRLQTVGECLQLVRVRIEFYAVRGQYRAGAEAGRSKARRKPIAHRSTADPWLCVEVGLNTLKATSCHGPTNSIDSNQRRITACYEDGVKAICSRPC